MKYWMVCATALLGLLSSGLAVAENKPEALIYISPHEYSHEVRLGVPPYFSKWMLKGPAVEAAAREALAPHFSSVALCDGVSGADVLVWVKPNVTYNPGIKRYYAQIKAQFHLGSGKQFGVYKATGEVEGAIGSVYADQAVKQAFTLAMQDIVRQYLADSAAQQALATALGQSQTKVPCALIGAIPKP
jgi:hypothetical protein